MQPPDWSDLQIFLAVARGGQFARAGAQLGMDPTTIGRRLRRLERALDQTLFEQTAAGQQLTEAGERLLARVEAMERSALRIGEETAGAAGPQGLVRLSCSEGFGSAFVAPRIGAFLDRHPGLDIDLAATSGFLNPSRREADIAVLLSRPRTGPLIARKLSDYRLRLYAAPAYVKARGHPADLSALGSGHRLIGYIPDMIYAPELRYIDEIATRPTHRLRSSSIVAQYRLVLAGAGVGVLPCFMAKRSDSLIRLLPDWEISRSFWLVTHRDTHGLARITAVRRWLIDIVGQDRDELLPADPAR